MISAIVLIHAESAKIPQVAQSIAEIPGIEKVYSTAGAVDLIAVVQVEVPAELSDAQREAVEALRAADDSDPRAGLATRAAS